MIDADTMRPKRLGNSFTTTIETTATLRMTSETPGTSSNMRTALRGVEYIAQHIKNADKDNEVSQIISPSKFFYSAVFRGKLLFDNEKVILWSISLLHSFRTPY